MFDDTMEMNYDEFIEYIKERMEEALEDDDVREVRIVPAIKNNQIVVDALQAFFEDGGQSPLIYLDSYFEDYRIGVPVDELVHNMVMLYRDSLENAQIIGPEDIRQFERIRDKITLRLVNAGQNGVLLSGCPHRNFAEELEVTYRIVAGRAGGGISTILVTNDLLDVWHVDEEQLYTLACENSLRLFPPVIESVRQMLERSFGAGITKSFKDSPDAPENKLYLLSNDCRINGAAALCYSDELPAFARAMDTDFFVIPSSIHEVILVPDGTGFSPHQLKSILVGANHKVIQKEDILSNGIYFYSRSRGKIEKYSGQMEGNLLQ